MGLTFVASIQDGMADRSSWTAWLRRSLLQSDLRLADAGELFWADRVLGKYRLLETEEAWAELGDAPWFSALALLPVRGRPIGYFAWTHAADNRGAVEHLIPRLMQLGRGVVARTDTGEHRTAIAKRAFALSDLLRERAFDDGEMYLGRDTQTLSEVAAEARQALANAGLEARVEVHPYDHNPVRIAGEVYRGGVALVNAGSFLESTTFTVWVYEWHILKDWHFWVD